MSAQLSDTEKYLWQFIQEHIEHIPSYSIVKLSEEANVSTATIVRTMKKKGYEGFTSFKHALKDQANTMINYSVVEKVDNEIKKAILKNEQEVIRSINMIDSGVIEDAVQKCYSAKRIVIFARGFSELIAEEMMVKFQLAGKYSQMHTDPNIITSISKKLADDDFVIFVSLNGETPELVVAAQNCYDQEISTLTISANRTSQLVSLSELACIGFKSEGSYFPDYEVRSRLPLSVIARILLDAYAIRSQNKPMH
ncbi:MurR/RpiR family transcriptional regulator [uncultured Enterococcus sp.]|uniref:MurR/RpiR family transcriptional regulator n=1 Tax=uncultured Enterococcus sp. TaxID=167972 RepID=UPI002AA7345D|nr:MurR/RpiR family transcriptional regulator [uncultured Enterococcus sp.]